MEDSAVRPLYPVQAEAGTAFPEQVRVPSGSFLMLTAQSSYTGALGVHTPAPTRSLAPGWHGDSHTEPGQVLDVGAARGRGPKAGTGEKTFKHMYLLFTSVLKTHYLSL